MFALGGDSKSAFKKSRFSFNEVAGVKDSERNEEIEDSLYACLVRESISIIP